ncbi:hypothetical protein MAR_012967, partial [Mya arenaria]
AEIVDKQFDGILALKLVHNDTETEFLIFSCYLPPEHSTRGRDAQSFFAHLLSLVYMYGDCDYMYIVGDFNSRIGTLSDVLDQCDVIPIRIPLDKSVNQHGHDFIEFLNDAKLCCLNGRICIDNDNFTSVSRKGRSVVDYICIPHDMFIKCKSFSVLPSQSIVDKHSLHGLLGERSRVPDHSVLIACFETDYNDLYVHEDTPSRARYDLKRLPQDFMSSETAKLAISNLISRIQSARETQTEMDTIYENLCSIIKTDDQLESKSVINLSKVDEHLNVFYARKWQEDVQHVPKLRTYRVFKTEFKTEEYVKLNMYKNERSIMCQFRSGVLPLRIETGRFIGEALNQRLCR